MTADRRKALYEAFKHKGIEPDVSFLLLNAGDALDLIHRGILDGLLLAGVEGFVVTDEGAYQPREEYSNDYVEFDGTRADFVKMTEKLIEKGGNAGIRFEVVFEVSETH
jgi:hypothetical protein